MKKDCKNLFKIIVLGDEKYITYNLRLFYK